MEFIDKATLYSYPELFLRSVSNEGQWQNPKPEAEKPVSG